MKKLYMKAPDGVNEATIEGHTYEIPTSGKNKGVIQVVSDTHIETLKRHDFVEHTPAEEVDLDSMSKKEVVNFLEQHGEDTDGLSEKKLRKKAQEILDQENED